MKKVISLLVAFATACSVSVAAFAADDIPGTVHESPRASMISSRIASVGQSGALQVGPRELFIVDAKNKLVGGVYNKLDPDTEYTFRIYYNNSNSTITADNDADLLNVIVNPDVVELSGALINKGTIQLRTIKGSSNIQSAKIKTIGRGDGARYEMVVNTRAYYGTKLNEVEYTLDVTGSASPAGSFAKSTHMFEVGYETINDNETDVGENGTITISNDAPVITKDQFVDIAKSANYKTVRFEGDDGGWIFTGRVSGMADSNFYYTYDVIPDIVNKFPDQEYKFLTFKAGVTFPTNGEMRIDVSDISDDFAKLHTYLFRNGKLTKIATTYDSGSDEIVFRTNYLGSFVITDTAITDTSVLGETDKDEEDEKDVSGEQGGTGNPNTGATSAMNLGVTLGLVSLVAASAISRKKK